MKGHDETSGGILNYFFRTPLQPINFRSLLSKSRSQTTLDTKNSLHIEKVRRLILLVSQYVNNQILDVPAR